MQKTIPEPIQFLPGDRIRLARGEYDSFEVDGLYDVLKPFTDHEGLKWFHDKYQDDYSWKVLGDFLVELGYLKEVSETHYWHWRDCDGDGYAWENAK